MSAIINARTYALRRKKMAGIRDLFLNAPLYGLTAPGVIFIFIFNYIPMFGIILAFEGFDPIRGLFGSPFVGFENFRVFFLGQDWLEVTWNTFFLNAIFLVTGTAASLFIAILITELGRNVVTKVAHSALILPNFISWPIVAMLAIAWLREGTGVIDQIMTFLHIPPIDFYTNAGVWPWTLAVFNIWKGAGFGSILYIATILGIDKELYESAAIDGASRIQRIFRITLPMMRPTIILLLLLALPGMFHGNTDMIFNLVGPDSLLFPTTQVIDTYVFRMIIGGGSLSVSAAIGMIQQFLSFGLIFVGNWLARRANEDYALF